MSNATSTENLSDHLIDQYRQIHEERPQYGMSSEQQLGFIQRQVVALEGIDSILDFGCGRSRLVDWLAKLNDATAYRYDPAIPEFSTLPVEAADLVLNTDVLEHIPEGAIDDILSRIRVVSERVYFNISCIEARATLPDGSNAHCTVQPADWWQARLKQHFSKVRPVKSYRESTCSFVTW